MGLVLDASLTELGRSQSQELYELTKDTIQKTAQLIVSSPLRRPMETMLIAFNDLKERLDAQGQGVILLDTLQEIEGKPCDTPLFPVDVLKSSNGGIFSALDFSTLSEGYASKTGIFDPVNGSERARQVRRWLRDRPEMEIVVVAHGDILRYLVDGQQSTRRWDNAELKAFTFVSEDDDNASLVAATNSIKPQDATDQPTSSQMEG
uniref:Phosphoglycerate mutase n=1 Tax=Kwoniella dejecticola CBS 10117 TaxID=1296121 RepID=A0A1A6A545_9TREE|nr:uncharacterized protein I303_04508 [Kwoniella dejecticola CBS 10117]OBR85176.1 hypothetical protein I303_04508 [Kwoniella dejecticola CBS 10117]